MILAIYSLTLIIASLVTGKRTNEQAVTALKNITVTKRTLFFIFLVALAILSAEIYKRFSSVGWSFDEVINQSLSARGGATRTWDRLAFRGGNAIYSLIAAFMPFAGIGFIYVTMTKKTPLRFLSFCLATLVLLILATDGTRTAPVIMLVSCLLYTSPSPRDATLSRMPSSA